MLLLFHAGTPRFIFPKVGLARAKNITGKHPTASPLSGSMEREASLLSSPMLPLEILPSTKQLSLPLRPLCWQRHWQFNVI